MGSPTVNSIWRGRANRRSEAGVGTIGSALGLAMVFGLLLLAVHTMLALHTRTLVDAAAWDAARTAAHSDGDAATVARQRANSMLTGLEPEVRVVVRAQTIEVRVRAKSPGFLPGVTSLDSTRLVERTAVVRREVLQ